VSVQAVTLVCCPFLP